MKIRTTIMVIATATFLGQASAAEPLSPAYVNQLDGASVSSMRTIDIVGSMASTAGSLAALRPQNGNLALVWQDGDLNTASISQNGVGNVGLIRQIGLENTASISQTGNGHQALVIQQGRGNQAFIRQR